EESTTQESENLTRWRAPPLGNRGISRAGTVHHSGIAESHAQEGSTAQESWNLAAGTVHRSGIGESHARQRSTAQQSRNLARRKSPAPRNRRILRAGRVHRSGIGKTHAREGSIAQELQNLARWEKIYRTRTPVKTLIE